MALSRLLLLCMLVSELWDAEAKPVAFVCNKGARRALNVVAEMEDALQDCPGSAALPTPVQLPCAQLHAASWGNQSLEEKRTDIEASLRLLAEGVKVSRAQSRPGCAASLLRRLESNIDNHLLIVAHLQLSVSAGHGEEQGSVVSTGTLPCVPHSTRSLGTVLLNYNLLLSGKLERFMVDQQHRCTSQ